MSEYRPLSYSFAPWEYRILIALLLILGGFYFTWEVILEDEQPQQHEPMSLHEPPTLIPWRETPPAFLQGIQIEGVTNPFFTQFPVEPQPVAANPPVNQPAAVDTLPEEPPQPPQPPPHTIAVTFRGVRVSLTGKTFAMIDIEDSEKGKESFYKKEGDSFADDFIVQSISEKTLIIKGPDGNTITELPFGDNKIFTIKANE